MVDDAGAAFVEWVDAQGRPWCVELPPDRVMLRSGADRLDLPADAWRRDLYITSFGGGFVIRFETFARTVAFTVSTEQASPFLRHLGLPLAAVVGADAVRVEESRERRAPLLWPRVSPLAVWALIASALVFIPFYGLLPAAATVILLILHRRKVRRTAAASHSRAVCTAAFVFLVVGSAVAALAAVGMRHIQDPFPSGLFAAPVSGERTWGMIAIGIAVVVLSLSVHEAAHAITAWWLGDGLARSLGRVTLNPIAHLDPIGTLLLPVLLTIAGGPVFGYARPVPVRVEALPRRRRAHILISLAGPGSNLLLACASLLMLLGLGCGVRLWAPDATVTHLAAVDFRSPVAASGFAFAAVFAATCTFLKLSFVVNVVLALFNLVPIPPLDGSWVLEHLFPSTLGRLYAVIRPYSVFIFLAAMYTDVFDYLMLPVAAVLLPGLTLLARATGW